MLHVVILLFFLVTATKTARKMDNLINGNWTNTLGSKVTLVAQSGLLQGEYQTAVVSNVEQNELPDTTPLSGTYQVTDDGLLITFNVQWRFKDREGKLKQSTTTWAGKLYHKKPDSFSATWLLVSDASLADGWGNTRVNVDTFTKV